jgi:transcriptional regulator with XRE-family HTH domain
MNSTQEKVDTEAEDAATDSENGKSVVSRRLRDIRAKKGLSVSELASRSSVSAGMISQIERGISSPSVKTLERLRTALDISLTDLFVDEDAPSDELPAIGREVSFVRRRESRPQFAVQATGLRKELLTPEGQHDLQFMLIHFDPGASSSDVLMGAGEKAGMVLSGEVELMVGGHVERIREGDSFQFDSTLAHRVRNLSAEISTVVWFMDTRRPRVEM